MELYTIDGLRVSKATAAASTTSGGAAALADGQGEQLVALYHLFARLHNTTITTSTSTTTSSGSPSSNHSVGLIEHMMKPEALERQQQQQQQQQHQQQPGGRSSVGGVGADFGSISVSMAAAATTSSVGQQDIPYPCFLLPPSLMPPVTDLKGFSDAPIKTYVEATARSNGGGSSNGRFDCSPASVSAEGAVYNMNRSANGADEIPIRACLLPRAEGGGPSGSEGLLWSVEMQVETSSRKLFCVPVELSKASGDDSGHVPLGFSCGVL